MDRAWGRLRFCPVLTCKLRELPALPAWMGGGLTAALAAPSPLFLGVWVDRDPLAIRVPAVLWAPGDPMPGDSGSEPGGRGPWQLLLQQSTPQPPAGLSEGLQGLRVPRADTCLLPCQDAPPGLPYRLVRGKDGICASWCRVGAQRPGLVPSQ